MYRHEAISIARTVMDRAGITEELQPWVVDAILAAVNGTVTPEPLPLEQMAMTREQANILLQKHLQGPMDPVQFDARILDAVLEAANRAKPWASYEQPSITNTDDMVAGDPESPIPALFPVSALPAPEDWSVTLRPVKPAARVPVAWRRRSRMDDRVPPWVYWMLETPPPADDGHEWQPLYAE